MESSIWGFVELREYTGLSHPAIIRLMQFADFPLPKIEKRGRAKANCWDRTIVKAWMDANSNLVKYCKETMRGN